jgi:hypothetical protein
MIRAAFDASMDSPSGVNAVGGYLGHIETWERLEERWNALLGLYRLERFRLTNVFHRFKEEQALEITAQFAGLINSSGLKHAAAHMLDTDWTAIQKDTDYLAVFPQRQHACLDMVLGNVAGVAKDFFPGTPVAVVFDNDYGNVTMAGRVYDAWCERAGHAGFGAVTFIKGENDWEVVPLQCADLLAGLTRRAPYSRDLLNGLGFRPLGTKDGDMPLITRCLLRAMPHGYSSSWSLAIAKGVQETRAKMNRETPEAE